MLRGNQSPCTATREPNTPVPGFVSSKQRPGSWCDVTMVTSYGGDDVEGVVDGARGSVNSAQAKFTTRRSAPPVGVE